MYMPTNKFFGTNKYCRSIKITFLQIYNTFFITAIGESWVDNVIGFFIINFVLLFSFLCLFQTKS